jgi:hypothetical protein
VKVFKSLLDPTAPLALMLKLLLKLKAKNLHPQKYNVKSLLLRMSWWLNSVLARY